MTRRVQKVAELLKQQLAVMTKATLPEDLGMVTVTDVEITADFKNATVFISCLDKSCEDKALKILELEAKAFQHILGRKLQMKYTPKLDFKIETGLEKINRLEEILGSLH